METEIKLHIQPINLEKNNHIKILLKDSNNSIHNNNYYF